MGAGKFECDQAAMLSGQAGDVIPGPPLTSENSFELQIQAQRKHLPISYLTCNGQHAFCLIRGTSDTQKQWVLGVTCGGRLYNISWGLRKLSYNKESSGLSPFCNQEPWWSLNCSSSSPCKYLSVGAV